MTYYHTFNGLKQPKFILSQFWMPEVPSQFHWAQVKGLAGLVPPEALGENQFPCASSLCRLVPSLAHNPLLSLQASKKRGHERAMSLQTDGGLSELSDSQVRASERKGTLVLEMQEN